ncbi:MAG: cupin domain-containing protein [Bacilli bacterium]
MAHIRFHDNDERIEDQKEVSAFLGSHEVIYEHWDMTKLPERLQENFKLNEEDKAEIIATFRTEIDDISARRGYLTEDVIVLSQHTPNLEDLLVKFQQEHHHSDDEVRFIAGGHGIFAIQGTDGRFFDVELNPGDLISVPENYRHYFTLQADRQVIAIRIFKTTEGWAPIY